MTTERKVALLFASNAVINWLVSVRGIIDPVAAALYDNLVELRKNAATEREQAAALLVTTGLPEGTDTTWVPTLPGDVHTMEALATIRGLLFD